MRVSIITPTIDNASFIQQAIDSVSAPPGVEVEHIVVHDGSEAFVRAVSRRHPHVKILRGRDRGPPDAVNLGFEAASGDFLLSLNSDDRLAANALRALRENAAAHPEIMIWTGGARLIRTVNGEDTVLREVAARRHTEPTWRNALDGLPLVNTRFLHRKVKERLGVIFNPRYTRCADRDALFRMILAEFREAPLHEIVAEYRMHEKSLSMNGDPARTADCLEQHLVLASEWLADPKVPPTVRALMSSWRGREGLRATYYRARAIGKVSGSAFAIGQMARHPLWLLSVPAAITASRWRRKAARPVGR